MSHDLPFRRLLIANRGEIASRIIRTAKRLGLETAAIYSEADKTAPFVRDADYRACVGPARPQDSYLNTEAVLEAARSLGADAVHPGYGFLSENAAFADAVAAAGMTWIGPPASAIRAMGLKDAAKALMQGAGVATTPGYHGDDQSDARLRAEALLIGYPLLIKAVAGGGGKGMRRVDAPDVFDVALAGARREARASFGDERVLLEVYVTRPRHIEVQVFADCHGNVVHLFERDCSLQRRHQKVIEEAPAPGMDEAVRAAVTGAAVQAAQAVGYEGAGTVEFIADGSGGLKADHIWFMEMNTRLQVEHPVTEAITGIDLVEWQIRVAGGEPLPLAQEQIVRSGWAMEGRLYAEQPRKRFLPSTGPLDRLRLPAATPTVRVDAGAEEGGVITPFYDPMIAKIIAVGPNRRAAARTLAEAVRRVEVWPVRTNAAFLARCLADEDFLAGVVDTGFIDARLDVLTRKEDPSDAVLASATQALAAFEAQGTPPGPWDALHGARGFRLNADPGLECRLSIDGVETLAHLPEGRPEGLLNIHACADGAFVIFEDAEPYLVARSASERTAAAAAGGDGALLSPMPGRIASVGVALGDRVAQGQVIVVLEAMKMEHALAAPFDGVVEMLAAAPGAQTSEGVVLARVKPLSADS